MSTLRAKTDMYLTMKPEGWKAKKWAEQLARGKMEASVDVVEPIM